MDQLTLLEHGQPVPKPPALEGSFNTVICVKPICARTCSGGEKDGESDRR